MDTKERDFWWEFYLFCKLGQFELQMEENQILGNFLIFSFWTCATLKTFAQFRDENWLLLNFKSTWKFLSWLKQKFTINLVQWPNPQFLVFLSAFLDKLKIIFFHNIDLKFSIFLFKWLLLNKISSIMRSKLINIKISLGVFLSSIKIYFMMGIRGRYTIMRPRRAFYGNFLLADQMKRFPKISSHLLKI